MGDPWILRAGESAEHRGIAGLWLESYRESAHARRMGDRYWSSHEPIVRRLLLDSEVRVLADRAEPSVLWAFAVVAQGGDVVHYALVKRAFQRWGSDIERTLFGSGKQSRTLTHELPRGTGIVVPNNWTLDCYWGWR